MGKKMEFDVYDCLVLWVAVKDSIKSVNTLIRPICERRADAEIAKLEVLEKKLSEFTRI